MLNAKSSTNSKDFKLWTLYQNTNLHATKPPIKGYRTLVYALLMRIYIQHEQSA